MKQTIAVIILALMLAPMVVLAIQYSTEEWTTPGFVPNSATAVTTRTVHVKTLYLANKSASAVTITIKDRSTNCGAAACDLWPTVSIAANSVYVVDMADVVATSGFTWQAGTASAVVGWVYYRY